MKLSSRHLKDSDRVDVVTQRAEMLRVTPEEIFARAFVTAGKSRSASQLAFERYCKKEGAFEIPPIVQEFCDGPLPKCANPTCSSLDMVARFTRTAVGGKTTYFCSSKCMDATPQSAPEAKEVVSSMEGRAILERVRVAMSNAVYAKVFPKKIRPMPGQPRNYFNPERMKRLAGSLKQVGQMTPGIIRKIEQDTEAHEYELLDGERRLLAAGMAGLSEYRAMLVEIDDQAAPYVVSVISNFNREEHTLLELSDAVVKMHEGLKLSMYEITDVLGLAHYNEASKLYGLRRLIPEVRDMLDPNLVKGAPLPKIAAIQISQRDPKDQLELAQKLMNKELTVTGLREHVRSMAQSRGEAFPQRYVSPENRRRQVKLRIEAMLRSAYDLNKILCEADVPDALREFSAIFIRELAEKIDASQLELGRCRTALNEVLKKKVV
jgi:ParB/RepB/Spo0J family partition protein